MILMQILITLTTHNYTYEKNDSTETNNDNSNAAKTVIPTNEVDETGILSFILSQKCITNDKNDGWDSNSNKVA